MSYAYYQWLFTFNCKFCCIILLTIIPGVPYLSLSWIYYFISLWHILGSFFKEDIWILNILIPYLSKAFILLSHVNDVSPGSRILSSKEFSFKNVKTILLCLVPPPVNEKSDSDSAFVLLFIRYFFFLLLELSV